VTLPMDQRRVNGLGLAEALLGLQRFSVEGLRSESTNGRRRRFTGNLTLPPSSPVVSCINYEVD